LEDTYHFADSKFPTSSRVLDFQVSGNSALCWTEESQYEWTSTEQCTVSIGTVTCYIRYS